MDMTSLTGKGSLIAGVLVAPGASVCCVASLMALAAAPKTVTPGVKNMTCERCPVTVRKSPEKVSGVSAVKVDFDRKTATITCDPGKAQPEALTRAATNAGYPSTLQK